MRRILALALTAAATVGGLTGCAAATTVPPLGIAASATAAPARSTTGSARCVDRVSFATSRERYAAADTVVVASIRATDRTVEDFAVYPVHRATDVQVLKGAAPEAFDVTAPSDRCERAGAPAEYLQGDPLDGTVRAVLYLRSDDDGTRRLLTPDGLDVLAERAPLPDLPAAG